jgi:hypothetical protein
MPEMKQKWSRSQWRDARKRFMKNSRMNASWLCVFVLLAAWFDLFGCASTRARHTESLLSAAGFHTLTPATLEQKACYAALPPYKMQRQEINGKVVYAFADKKTGIVYAGGESQYQEFQRLAHQQRIASEQLQAAQMNQNAAMNWG